MEKRRVSRVTTLSYSSATWQKESCLSQQQQQPSPAEFLKSAPPRLEIPWDKGLLICVPPSVTPKVQIVGTRTTFVECKLGSFCLGHVVGFLWRSNKAISIKTLWGCKIPCRCKELISACLGSEKEVAKRGRNGEDERELGVGQALGFESNLKPLWDGGKGFQLLQEWGSIPTQPDSLSVTLASDRLKDILSYDQLQDTGKRNYDSHIIWWNTTCKGHASETLLMTWGDA